MELVPKPKLTTILLDSRRLIKSHRRRFFVLLLALFFIGLLSLTLSSAESRFISLFTTGNGDLVPSTNDNDRPTLIWSMIGIFLSNLFLLTLSIFTTISVTSVVLQSLNEDPDVGLSSVAKSICASFFPIVATNLLQLVISFLVCLGFVMIFGLLALSAYFLGFRIDPVSPLFQLLAIIVIGVPGLLVVAYMYFVSWGLVTAVVVAESTWGFAAMKRSKSLVNGKRCIAIVLFLIFTVLYTIIDRLPFDGMVIDPEENKSFVATALLVAAQVVVNLSLSSMLSLYDIVATTLFYVYCKGVHEEGLYYGDSQYVKLAIDDGVSKHRGYAQI